VKADSSFHLCTHENAVATPSVSVGWESCSPSIAVVIEGITRTLVIDTGSNVSILHPNVSRNVVEATAMRPHGVTGQTLDIKGRKSVSFEISGSKFSHTFLVCALPMDAADLLGTDFVEGAGAIINFGNGKMSFAKAAAIPRVRVESPTDATALTVFTLGKEGHSPQPSYGTWQVDEKSASSRCNVTAPQSRT
jgi:hypothetical protein